MSKNKNIAPEASEEVVAEPVQIVEDTAMQAKPKKKAPAKKARPAFDSGDYVTVRNGCHCRLKYRDMTTGATYEWRSFGDEEEMTVGELQRARSSQPAFFTENWWLFDDPELVEYLRATRYYKNTLTMDEFNGLFDMPASKIAEAVAKMPSGQRSGVVSEAKRLIEADQLYDIRVIRALENALQV